MEEQARKELEKESALTGEPTGERPEVLEEIEIEDLTVDGICGVY
jgi:mycofactocin precursor